MKINYNSPYVKWGLTAFIVLCASISFYFLLKRNADVATGIGTVVTILRPFIYGLVVAYLLCPIYNVFTKIILKGTGKIMPHKKAMSVARILSTTATILLAFMVLAGLVSLVLPQFIDSAIKLIKTAPESLDTLLKWGEAGLSKNADINSALHMLMGDYTEKFNAWLDGEVLPKLIVIATQVSTGLFDIMKFFWDFIIGIIICVYFLNSKEIFKAQSAKFVFAFLDYDRATTVIREAKFINKTFVAFISGKIIDSFIIGVICFVVLNFMHMPYVMLVSVIVGVTNIIPFFGPFIGAIPSTIFILTESPIQALYFVIFVLILQQIDGNVIGPRILGEATGIPSFWVMFAILFGGGMFGFIGMIVGIPTFAVIYEYLCRFINNRLARKNMSTDLEEYKNFSNYENTERQWANGKQ